MTASASRKILLGNRCSARGVVAAGNLKLCGNEVEPFLLEVEDTLRVVGLSSELALMDCLPAA